MELHTITGSRKATSLFGTLKEGFHCDADENLDAPKNIAAGSHYRVERWSEDGRTAEATVYTDIAFRGR